jgi:hypothetical protein
MRPAAWGIDLTGGALRALHVERAGRRFRIIDAVEIAISGPGEGAEPLKAHLADGVERALAEFVRTRGAALADPVMVAVPVFGSRHGRAEVAVRGSDQVEKLLEFEVERSVADHLEPWIVRRGPTQVDSSGAPGCDWFAARREHLQCLVDDLVRGQLPFDGLVPGPVALARYVELEWPGRGRRLVIECQRTRTDLLFILGDGRRRWRSLPVGCGALADAPVGPERIDAANRLADRLRAELREAHAALLGAHDGTPPERVILLGEAARHPELRQTLAEAIGQELVTPHAPRAFIVTARAAPQQPLHHGTALGLALAALDRRGEPFSLCEPPRGRRLARAVPVISGALLALSAGLLATDFIAERELHRLAELRRQISPPIDSRLHAEWSSAAAAITAANGWGAKLAEEIADSRRRWPLPRRLVTALAEAAPPFRLVSCAAEPGDPADQVRLSFETTTDSSGTIDAITALLRDRVGVAVTGVEKRAGADGSPRYELIAALPREGGQP